MDDEKYQTTIIIIKKPWLHCWEEKEKKKAKIKVEKYWLSSHGGVSSKYEFPIKPKSYEDEAKARKLIKDALGWDIC